MLSPAEVAPTITTDVLRAELALQSHGGPNVEPPTAAMFGALLMSEHCAIKSLIDDAAERASARRITRGPAISALRTTLIDYFRLRSEANEETFSDASLLTPDDWTKPISMLAEDLQFAETDAVESIYAGLYFREAATPVKERYASIAAMTQLVSERFPAGARALSIGCSVMAGELQLLHSDEFPMSLQQVSLPDQARRDVTPQVNQIVGRKMPFNQLVGVDINLLYDEAHQQYDRGNAHFALSGLRPSERNNPAYIGDLRLLMAKKQKGRPEYTPDSGVIFHRANLIKPEELGEFNDQFPEPFDVIMMNFMTQELSPADQIRLHDVATQLVSDDGLIMYNHQAYIPPPLQNEPTDIGQVIHYSSYAITEYTSAMHYVDMLNPVRGVQEAMRFHDNRCQVARVNNLATLMVNGSLEPLSDLLAHS